VEDHYPQGGIGEAVAAAVQGHGIRMQMLAVRELPRSGKPEQLLAAYGIDATSIAQAVRHLVRQR
jgi:transketolase